MHYLQYFTSNELMQIPLFSLMELWIYYAISNLPRGTMASARAFLFSNSLAAGLGSFNP
jgi:hypothetical protein